MTLIPGDNTESLFLHVGPPFGNATLVNPERPRLYFETFFLPIDYETLVRFYQSIAMTFDKAEGYA